MERIAAQAAPPNVEDIRHLIRVRGVNALREQKPPVPLDLLRRTANWLNDYGKSADARTVLEVAVESYPDSARAHYALAVLLTNLGDGVKAAEHLEKTIQLAPNDPRLDDATRKRMIDGARERLARGGGETPPRQPP